MSNFLGSKLMELMFQDPYISVKIVLSIYQRLYSKKNKLSM